MLCVEDIDVSKFDALIQKTQDCWLWIGDKYPNQYGRFYNKGTKKRYRATLIAYLLNYGSVDEDLYICHSCDNPICVNPQHLFLGTCLDNNRDRNNKFRDARKVNKAIVSIIRKLYLENVQITSKSIQKFLFKNYDIKLSTVGINCILKNKTYHDLTYNYKKKNKRLILQGLNVGGSKYSREIIDDILYLRQVGYKLNDISCIIVRKT